MLPELGRLYTVGDTNGGDALVHNWVGRYSYICSELFGQRPGPTAFARARRLHHQARLHVSLSTLALGRELGTSDNY